MKHNTKRFLSLLLALFMLISLLPLSVWAEEAEPETEQASAETVTQEPEAPAAGPESPAPEPETPVQAEEATELPAPAVETEGPETEQPETPFTEETALFEEGQPEELSEESSEASIEPEKTDVPEADIAQPEEWEEEALPEEGSEEDRFKEQLVPGKLADAVFTDGKAVFTVSLLSGEAIAYQWQRLDVSFMYENAQARENAWADMPGETGPELVIREETVFTDALFRCAVSDDLVRLYTNEVKIVLPAAETEDIAPAAETASVEAFSAAVAPIPGEDDPAPEEASEEMLPDEVSLLTSPETGKCGENVTATLQDGILTVTGTGAMSDGEHFWSGKQVDSVIIAEGITAIGNNNFRRLNITSVTLPSTLKTIGGGAFNECKKLTTIVLPEGLETVNGNAFHSVPLTSLTLPSTLKTVGRGAFTGSRIEQVHIASLESWLGMTFGDAFEGAFTWIDGLYIGDTQITDLVIPEGTEALGRFAFYNCGGFASVTFPSSLKTVPADTFKGTSTKVYVNSEADWLSIQFGNADANPAKYLYIHGELPSVFTAPEGTAFIPAYSFTDCVNIKTLILPASVTEIGRYIAYSSSGLRRVVCLGARPNTSGSFSYHTDMVVYIPEGNAGWTDYVYSFPYTAGTAPWTEGHMGSDPEWMIDGDGNFVLFGSNVELGGPGEAPWYPYRDEIKNVLLLNQGSERLTYAFYGCKNLTEVIRQYTTTVYYEGMYYGCQSLSKGIDLTARISQIGDYAFYGCSSLTGPLTLTGSLSRGIGRSAFENCTALDEITAEKGVMLRCGRDAFKGTAWMNAQPDGPVYLLDSVITVKGSCPAAVEIKKGTRSVAANAFAGCTALQSVVLPSSLTAVYASAFEGSGLKTLELPAALNTLGDNAFKNCTALEWVRFTGTPRPLDGVTDAFAETACTVYYPGNNALWTEAYRQNYGGTLTWVPYEAGEAVVQSGTLGDAVWTVSDTGVARLFGEGTVSAPYGISEFKTIKKAVISEGVTVLTGVFQKCTALEEVVLPGSLTEIGQDTFRGCSSLTSVTLPRGVTAIGAFAFVDSALQELVCPDTLEQIGRNAFAGSAIRSLTVPASAVFSNLVFDHCYKLEELILTPGTGTMPDYDTGTVWSGRGGGAHMHVTVQEGVKNIGAYAFYNLACLQSISLPSTVTEIGMYAFDGCTALTELTMNGQAVCTNIETVRGAAFRNTALSESFPLGKLISAGSYAFYGTALTELAGFASLQSIGSYCFGNCRQLMIVKVPESVTSIDLYAFSKSGVIALSIPEGITEIPKYMCAECADLSAVVLPGSLRKINEYAFYHCNLLNTVQYSGTREDWETLLTVAAGNDVLKQAKIYYAAPLAGLALYADGKEITGQTLYVDMSVTKKMTFTAKTVPDSDYAVTIMAIDGDRAEDSINTGTAVPGSDAFLDVFEAEEGAPVLLTAQADNSLTLTFVREGAVVVMAWDEAELQYAAATLFIRSGTPLLTLQESYLMLKTGENVLLHPALHPENMKAEVTFAVPEAYADILSVDETGRVTALSEGTGYAEAMVTLSGKCCTARCRVDVTPAEGEHVCPEEIKLLSASASVEVYKTAGYARVLLLPVFEQNRLLGSGEEEKVTGLTAAHFADENVDALFTLRVKDDRTLEIIPTDAAVELAGQGKKLKTAYSSAITLDTEFGEFTTPVFKVLPKKSVPKLKLAPVTLKFWREGLELVTCDPVQLSFTGGAVKKVSWDAAAAKKVKQPVWFRLSEDGFASFEPGNVPVGLASGKLFLRCEADGWRPETPIRVTGTAKAQKITPKLTFRYKSLTVRNESSRYAVPYTVSAAGLEYLFTPYVSRIELKVGKKYADIGNNDFLCCACADGELIIRTIPDAYKYASAQFRVTVSYAGKNYTIQVSWKNPAGFAPKASVSGKIYSARPGSSVKITVTPGATYTGMVPSMACYVKPANGTSASAFTVTQDGNAFYIRETEPGTAAPGTYQARIVVVNKELIKSFTVSGATPPAISVSTVKQGKLELIRPDSAFMLTLRAKNWFMPLENVRWTVSKKTGKTYTIVATSEDTAPVLPFTLETYGDVCTVKAGSGLTAKDTAYYLTLSADIGGKTYKAKPVLIPVKTGSAAVTCSAGSVTLYKNDRFSRGEFTLTVTDTTVAPVTEARLDAASAQKVRLVPLGGNEYALTYPEGAAPASFKAFTAKITLYTGGNAIGTVSVKVSYK